jgi:hypothetical protein
VLCGVTLALDKFDERRRQLMVNEELHVVCSTTWSVWCAA